MPFGIHLPWSSPKRPTGSNHDLDEVFARFYEKVLLTQIALAAINVAATALLIRL